jgi:hypothetical protein
MSKLVGVPVKIYSQRVVDARTLILRGEREREKYVGKFNIIKGGKKISKQARVKHNNFSRVCEKFRIMRHVVHLPVPFLYLWQE